MSPESSGGKGPVLFVYWGRRGALSAFTLEVCEALARRPDVEARVSISSANEMAGAFGRFGDLVLPFDTFQRGPGALLRLPAGWLRIRRLARQLETERYRAVVVLMPHLWTPFLGTMLRNSGIRYVVVVHDADPHPGDRTALATPWLLREARHADAVITLSQSVRSKLIAQGRVSPANATALLHPTYGALRHGAPRQPHEPFRFLFFGRIAAYKGLSILVDAAEMLRRGGVAFSLTVVGEGNLGGDAERLAALSATVVNEWVSHEELARHLAAADAVVLPYVEASQSGVAALALGHGVPVIVSASGGLAEQVRHEVTGLVVEPITAETLAPAMRRLVADRPLYGALAGKVADGNESHSVDSFLGEVLSIASAVPKLAGPCR